MFGNLSKTLIKAPHSFNNLSVVNSVNQTSRESPLPKISEETFLDSYSTVRKSLNIQNYHPNHRYFKPRDYWKNKLKLDLNFNNYYRKELEQKCLTKPVRCFEEVILGIKPNNINNNNFTYSNNLTNSYNNNTYNRVSNYKKNYDNEKNHFDIEYGTNKIRNKSLDNKYKTYKTQSNSNGRNKIKEYLNKTLISKESKDDFNNTIKTNVEKVVNRINNIDFSDNNFIAGKKWKYFFKDDNESPTETLNSILYKDTVYPEPKKIKFPNVSICKSQDKLFRESLDEKFKSLTTINPKIKEQLKSKNRCVASRNDFNRFNLLYLRSKNNPFSETIKFLEDMNNTNI